MSYYNRWWSQVTLIVSFVFSVGTDGENKMLTYKHQVYMSVDKIVSTSLVWIRTEILFLYTEVQGTVRYRINS